jgi:hypothetical protein
MNDKLTLELLRPKPKDRYTRTFHYKWSDVK